ncbi:MAG: hypothetical protein EZS28_022571 [Streblomastix strix]|uniref:Uncharacterized protein n=1 Tax=Streblomastix strix TaxID=222440 RepID=A0A5J4VH47_9EUKA|nr:MAG: hypothetical protein EZS28_022571 [Streblomastix strix]
MVAGPAMDSKHNESIMQIPYLQTVKSMHNQGTKHGKSKKFFISWKDSSISNGPEVEKDRMFLIQILDRIGLSRGAYQLLFSGQRFETQMHFQQAMRILAKFYYELCLNRRDSNTQGIRQLFDYKRSRLDDKDLSDSKIQTKLASLLLPICFIRINEAAEINLAISNIDYRNQTTILCLSTKVNNSIEQYEIKRTGDPKNSDKRRTSLWSNPLLREIGICGATAYSFNHAASTELARQGLQTTKVNIFTHHRIFLRAARNYNIYSANAGINGIASQLVGNQGQSQATQTISLQRSGAIERNDISTLLECYLQHSGNSTLLRISIIQLLTLPLYETLPAG